MLKEDDMCDNWECDNWEFFSSSSTESSVREDSPSPATDARDRGERGEGAKKKRSWPDTI